MKTPGAERFKPKDHISVTQLCGFARCPRKYFYQQGLRLTPERSLLPLEFGQAIHKGLPFCHDGDLKGALEAFQSIWKDQEGDLKRNSWRAKAMFESFILSHTGKNGLYGIVRPRIECSGEELLSNDNSIDEVAFTVSLGNNLKLVGRVDAIGKHRDTNKLWIIEYKTSSELSTRFISSFNLSPQVLVYTMALRELNVDVEGVIIEGLLVHKQRCETLALPINVPKHQTEPTKAWVEALALRMRQAKETEVWLQDFSGCSPYPAFGQVGYVCDYEPLCLQSDWRFLETLYKERG